MAKFTVRQPRLRLQAGRKTDVRAQFAALCWRVKKDDVQVCLVTSRTRGRWILPKGWPMNKQTPAAAAAMEAYEEAGLKGDVSDSSLGVYTYVKPLNGIEAPIVAIVYPLHVTHVLSDWPEKGQRKRKWFSLKKAARKLDEPDLRQMVAAFNPQQFRH
jgi:8-oxo-dGTP pyrophosphatase MutT (NUDIX family)